MAAWDIFMPLVQTGATDAPGPLVRQQLRLAAREFCKRTNAWVEWIDAATTLVPGVYTFTKPTDAELVRISGATVAGRPIDLSLLAEYASDPVDNGANEAPAVSTGDLGTFMLTGAVTADPVKVKAILMPTIDAATCPDLLATRYLECIAAGARFGVLSTAGASFANPDGAALANTMFTSGINKAITQVFLGNTTKTRRAQVRWC